MGSRHNVTAFHSDHSNFVAGRDVIFSLQSVSSANSEPAECLSQLNFSEHYQEALRKQTIGTCKWFLRLPSFVAWQEDDRTRTLLCYGYPGVGKTVLSSIVIDNLAARFRENRSVAVLYIYCKYGVRHTVEEYSESLVQQLYRRKGSFCPQSVDILRKCQEDETRPSLEEIYFILTLEAQSFSRVFTVVDGLDEVYPDDVQDGFIRFLERLVWTSSFRALVTTRHDPSLLRSIERAIKVPIQASREDILLHIETKIDQDRRIQSILREANDPKLKDKILRKVAEKADGIFLIADLHVSSLASTTRAGLWDALDTLPCTPESTYIDAVRRIDNQAPQYRDLAYCILSWLLYSWRPMKMVELRYALAMSEKSRKGDTSPIQHNELPPEDIILSCCAGLITVNFPTNEVNFVHYTVKQHLATALSNSRRLINPTNLALICLKFIAQHDLHLVHRRPWLPWKSYLPTHEFLEYASIGWVKFAQSNQDHSLILPLIDGLFRNPEKAELLIRAMIIGRLFPISCNCHKHGNGHSHDTPLTHVLIIIGLHNLLYTYIQMYLHSKPHYIYGKDYQYRTPLFFAAFKGHTQMVHDLLQFPTVDPDSKDVDGYTPLLYCAGLGHTDVVQLLLSTNRVDVEARRGTITPISLAVSKGYMHIVKLLLNTGRVKINLYDLLCTTKFLAAVKFRDTVTIQGALTEFEDRMPLMFAAEVARLKLAQFSQEINTVNTNSDSRLLRRTLLLAGSSHDHLEMVKMLLKTGRTYGVVKYNDSSLAQTLLFCSARSGSVEIARHLLTYEALDVNARDVWGRTALTSAVRYGHMEIVKLLFEVGNADPYIVDDKGRTAIDNAHQLRYLDIVDYLQSSTSPRTGINRRTW